MPTPQSNIANPQAFNIKLPGEGTVFRDVGDNTGSTLYTIKGGQLQNIAAPQYRANTAFSTGGQTYKAGDLLGGNPKDVSWLDPNYRGAATSSVSAADVYNQQNGLGSYDKLPTQNMADLQTALAKGQAFGSSQQYNGPSVAADTQAQLASMPANAPNQTVNQTAGALPAQAAALQGTQQSTTPQPFGPGYGPLGVPNGAPAAQTQALQSVADGNSTTTTPNPQGTTPAQQTAPPAPAAGNSADQYLQNYLSSMTPSSDELATQQKLNDLTSQQANVNASRDLGIQGVNEQPIATPFLTGQSTAIANRAATQQGALGAQAVPLQQQLALQQSKRQSAVDISKAELDYSQKQAELNKPINVSYGGSIYDPKSGQLVANNNPTSDPLISAAIQNGQLTPDMLTRYGSASVLSTLKNDPNFNFITGLANKIQDTTKNTITKDAFGNIVQVTPTVSGAGSLSPAGSGGTASGYKAGQLTALLQSQGKPTDDASLAAMYKAAGLQGTYANDPAHNGPLFAALGGQPSGASGSSSNGGVTNFPAADAASLKKQQDYADSTQRAFNTANQNLQQLVTFMQTAGVNSGSSVPLINSIQDKIKAGVSDPGTIAAYQAALAGLRAEYAQVLSRGGEVTEGQRAQASSLIPDNLTPQQLQQVTDRLKIEGANAINEANQQIQTIKNRVNGVSTPPAGSASSSSTSSTGGNPLGI